MDNGKLLGQIQSNYIEAFNFLLARKTRQVQQLVLLNNMQRGDQTIGSTLMLTLFNRTQASLYDDKIQVKFLPSQGINQDQINAYNVLAQSDYMEMGKAKLDYDWSWDTLFFGRGYMETYQFDKKRKIMKPHVINPLVLGYDPFNEDPQQWRYYWKWITKNKWEINALIKTGKITGIKSADEIPSGIDPYIWQYKVRRDAAALGVQPPIEPAANDVYQILEYFGYNDEGDKCIWWTDKNQSMVLMEEKLELDDMEGVGEQKMSKWPIVVKEMFRIPHASIPFSVADLLEDKHRAKSVLLNLAFIAAKDVANPIYLYDPDKVKDVAQFLARQVNQHIPVEGDPMMAVQPLNKAPTMSPELVAFMTALQQEANDPIGTGVSMEPQSGGQGTATEAALDQQMNDMAQSLASKVLQFGESEFWSQWWHRYQKHGAALGFKMANIVGVKGVDTKEIDLALFDTMFPPGVNVFSAKEAEYKNLVKRRDWMTLMPELQANMDPSGFHNFMKYIFMPLMVEDPSLIDIMFPDSLEEIKAREQNEMLKEDKLPQVLDTDDHQIHIMIHRMLDTDKWAKWVHIAEHEAALAKQKAMEQQAVMQQLSPAGGSQGESGVQSKQSGPSFGAEKSSPLQSASPLKQEAKTPLNSMTNK